MFYFVKTPWWLKKLYPRCVWDIPAREKVLYLTFDDGPHPEVTPFVLDTLKQYNAKATFFCIGKNVAAHKDVYRSMLDDGHRAGNHTFHHLNGWKATDEHYLKNILEAGKYIDSNLFRPPYGRITRFQVKLLSGIRNSPVNNNFSIIMWDVLSGDFDRSLTGAACASYVTKNAQPGSIVVFHDSEKAFPRLREALPKTLEHFSKAGYRFESIRL
jgi:peptidoglycan/xylan/chitin deacetylase (PgdA/CDA1 family)